MVIPIFFQAKNIFFQVMDNYGLPGISRELIVQGAGLIGFKRILSYTRIRDIKKLRSILRHLHWKIENLEPAPEKSLTDWRYIRRLKYVAKWLESYLYHLGGGLCAKVSYLPAKSP